MLEGQHFEPAGRLAQFMRMVDAFERDEIEAAVDGLIALLDAADGDSDREPSGDEYDQSYPERRAERGLPLLDRFHPFEEQGEDDPLEANGDELDGNASEDDFMVHHHDGPGCPIADEGEPDGDERDTNNAEDEATAGDLGQWGYRGPGCPIGDPGGVRLALHETEDWLGGADL